MSSLVNTAQKISEGTELNLTLLTDSDCKNIQEEKSLQMLEKLEKYESGSQAVNQKFDDQGSNRFNRVQIVIFHYYNVENWIEDFADVKAIMSFSNHLSTIVRIMRLFKTSKSQDGLDFFTSDVSSQLIA